MRNHHGGVVLVNGYLYGFSDAILTCMEFATGKVIWRDRSVGKGALTYADGNRPSRGRRLARRLGRSQPERLTSRTAALVCKISAGRVGRIR